MEPHFLIWNNKKTIKKEVKMMLGFPGGSAVKNLPASTGDVGLILGLGRFFGGEMATHSSILAWEIVWTKEPGGQQSIRSWRVRHNLATKQEQQQKWYYPFAWHSGKCKAIGTKERLVVTKDQK